MKALRLRLCAGALLALVLCACGVNPVTGKREIQFISQAQELQMGEQYYAPTRQSEGGDFKLLPELTAYVNEVGQKLAAVADRDLPYEFVVLNSSVPNAWALPGGKIAVNRGLLTELKNESELAAVLGHEIVHAAARHGAKAQERGTLLQAGVAVAAIGAAVGGADENVAGLLIQGAGVGAQLVQMKYGREQELESDEYGMKYMKKAGYDPWGAVTLQESFVRLANESGAKQQSFLEGLFASHPPSDERVERNKQTAEALGRGGEVGAERYAAHVKPLLEMKPAYDKYDQALAAASKKNYAEAKKLANEAVALLPKEARFHQALGEIELSEKNPSAAIPHFEKAIQLDPDYFASYLGGGVAQYRVGNKDQAERWLARSAELLPTAPAAYFLGEIARGKGDLQSAVKYYQAAATSQSDIGKAAAGELVRLELPQNPGKHVAAFPQIMAQGQLVLVVENRSPISITDIRLTPVLVDAAGRILQTGAQQRVPQTLRSGERIVMSPGVGQLSPEQLQRLRYRIDSARAAE
ncbi:MAG: M48 family metalloprotease [Steroidobacteraceae bacterium]|nr:M48 family metalloprotease [Steroidobacteraceae bacterium]